MKLLELDGPPDPELAGALARFEEEFRYPLGPERTFRISHGRDYGRFFRAMGEARIFLVLRGDSVAASCGVAIRSVFSPEGAARPAAYVGDLKVAREARGGPALARVARAAAAWAVERADAAYSVVMTGTARTPDRYTGRVGIPGFAEIGRVAVLKIEGDPAAPSPAGAPAAEGLARFRRAAAGGYAAPAGDAALRSDAPPAWIASPAGATGLLEDTRRAKRLVDDAGAEIAAAHLSNFAYDSPAAGAALLLAAAGRSARSGLPSLFAAAPAEEAEALRRALPAGRFVEAPATVYGTGFSAGLRWRINTAEI